MQKWAAMRCIAVLALVMVGCVANGPTPADPHLVAGSIPQTMGPDGNSVFLEAPEGLILVDTGRHLEHSAKLIEYARQRGRPIVAIINTHWHLDHTTGNMDIRRAYPEALVFATTAVEGALVGFLPRGREDQRALLANPDTPSDQRMQASRAQEVVENPDWLRPTEPVLASGSRMIAGRRVELRLSAFAATEADLWLYDPASRTVIVGDLVVGIVPFMDSACPDGWAKALEEIEQTPFKTLIPGHGAAMTRQDFLVWKSAFDNLLACSRSTAETLECVAGWEGDAARFIPASHREYVRQAAAYYITSRLRSPPDDQQLYCKPVTLQTLEHESRD